MLIGQAACLWTSPVAHVLPVSLTLHAKRGESVIAAEMFMHNAG
jgi:hypothetical protein